MTELKTLALHLDLAKISYIIGEDDVRDLRWVDDGDGVPGWHVHKGQPQQIAHFVPGWQARVDYGSAEDFEARLQQGAKDGMLTCGHGIRSNQCCRECNRQYCGKDWQGTGEGQPCEQCR